MASRADSPIPSRPKALLLMGSAYLAALAVAWAWLAWGPATSHRWLDTLLADVLASLVIFACSRLAKNSSFYDAYWSVAPPVILAFWFFHAHPDADPVRLWLAALVVILWAVRLTEHFMRVFPGHPHEDWRYAMLRSRAPRWELGIDLTAIHLFPTLQVFLGCVPLYIVASSTRPFGWLDAVATVIGVGGVALSFVADRQLDQHVARFPGRAMQSGLWSWSRHPNYFGEFLFWVGVAVFGLASSPESWWWIGVGAAAMAAMFLGASIPMMEERSLARRPEYAQVVARVSRFVPRPPRPAE